jgi:hypothetical protein
MLITEDTKGNAQTLQILTMPVKMESTNKSN